MTAPKRSALQVSTDYHMTYLFDDRRAQISRWMQGNAKLGPGVYSYSRMPGNPYRDGNSLYGTCPGSTSFCEEKCYAKRIVNPLVVSTYEVNSASDTIPDLPLDAKLVRIHVSGDFDSKAYILNWMTFIAAHPDVTFWSYTRAWRVPALSEWIEGLRDLPNLQLFASVDRSSELPPDGWRIAWIDDDSRLMWTGEDFRSTGSVNGAGNDVAYVCPEETGRKADCASCGYCFRGQRGDVCFLEH